FIIRNGPLSPVQKKSDPSQIVPLSATPKAEDFQNSGLTEPGTVAQAAAAPHALGSVLGIETLSRFRARQRALATPADAADPTPQGPTAISGWVVSQGGATPTPQPVLQQIRDLMKNNHDA